MTSEELEALRKRFERESRARREAEQIAERVTGDLYATSRDLQRANEELQTLNQALRDFVAVASHDLRNPITVVLGWAATLGRRWETISDEKKRESFAIIEREALHMSRMVEDLLTLSKIEAGALNSHAEVVALRAAVDDVIKNFSDGAGEISVSLPPDVDVLVDYDHLRRILANFVGNAIKYGAPPIEVVASECGEWIEIRVRDRGDGVPPEFVPRLFGRFARADTESTRAQRGTGLGLSIVRGLAEANGGETWYEPNSPKGSCFALRLPNAAA